MRGPIEVRLCHGCGGWYVEWVQEDDGAALGYRVNHWYGSREDCVKRAAEPAPRLFPVESDNACPSGARAE